MMVDSSDTEENGLHAALSGNLINKMVRGCKFHHMLSTEKVTMLVTETEMRRVLSFNKGVSVMKQMFIHLAKDTRLY